MKILYDYQVFALQKYGGATRYFCELMKNIPPEHQFELAVIFADNYYLKENSNLFKKIDILPGQNFKGKYFIEKKITLANRYYSRHRISANKFDLLHPTYFDSYFFKVLKKPYILTVHDLTIFKFNDPVNNPDWKKVQMETTIKRANRIIAISENTKKDMIEILNIHPEMIDVIYHGYNKPVAGKLSYSYGKYILFIGRRSFYKNFIIFAEAVSKLLNKEKDIRLVCVGSPFSEEEMALLSRLGISEQAIAVNVDDNSLNNLYAEALVFVYPSLYEGFGMPILEAFANNCPICLSNTSCFPEIAGNAGVYFDPNSPESIRVAMEKVIYDNDFAKEMVQAGLNRLADFSWDKAAKETISSYEKAV